MNAYDSVLYINRPYAQTHPDRLAVLARLHGLNPPPVEAARVLDIGTSEGGNLIPMAMTLPRGQFTGIDLAAIPIERGNQVVQDLGIGNVRLLQMNMLDITREFGEFDYIIAHGLYAWTPPRVRDKLLEVVETNLSPNGLAFISYNTHPGGHIRKILRDAMLEHIGDATDPAVKLARARQMLHWMAAPRPQPEPFDAGFAKEASEVAARTESSLFHDYLADCYEPVSLRDFVRHAAEHQLAHVADASILDSYNMRIPAGIAQEVYKMYPDSWLDREQHLDFLRMRNFRQSVLCRAGLPVQYELQPAALAGLYMGSPASEAGVGEFRSPAGVTVTTEHPGVVGMLRELMAIWPRTVPIANDADAELILELFRRGLIELHSTPSVAASASDRPEVFALARYQAAHGASAVCTLDHRAIELNDETSKVFLTKVDGTRDRAALAAEMHRSEGEIEERLQTLVRYSLLCA